MPLSKNQAKDKGAYVEEMFTSIAPYYDSLNRLLSFSRDRYWRRIAVSHMTLPNGGLALDICTGTADVALEIVRQFPKARRILGVDFCEPMLRIGQEKVGRAGMKERIRLIVARAEALPFREETFDATIVAFGVRNYGEIKEGLEEMARVTRKDGRAIVLDFSTPPGPAFQRLYHFYFHRILPLLGRAISGNPEAYSYLPMSVSWFPSPGELQDLMLKAGFRQVEYYPLTRGIVTLHVGLK